MLLPETKEQWEEIKKVFLGMSIEDTPESWTFILSQLQNTKMPELEFDPCFIFNHYKRWKIAKVLQDEKTVYISELENKLNEAMLKMVQGGENGSPSEHTEHVQDGALYSEGELPSLPTDKETVVSST